MNEVIKLLKEAISSKATLDFESSDTLFYLCKKEYIDKALALLEQQSKRTCPACGYKYGIDEAGNWFDEYVLLRDRLEAAEKEQKKKDELIFAYESTRTPINPLVQQQTERIKELENLLTAYRNKRKVDGSNGRIWDAHEHRIADERIEKLEQALGKE